MSRDIRLDHKLIAGMIEEKARVLDLGCGDGELLHLLAEEKNARVQGIELSEHQIYACVEKGVSVFHGDIEGGLRNYPDTSFDYVILNQSMQETKNVQYVIEEALRVGEKVIIGFPNFAFWDARGRLFFRGKVPITKSLPYEWYNTPNLHFLSLTDFVDFCGKNRLKILRKFYLGKGRIIRFFPNLFALNGLFLITRWQKS